MHSKNTTLGISIVGGFIASFLTFLLLPLYHMTGLTGQLIAGDQAANRQFPTTLNMMHAALDGSNPMITNLSSFSWWVMVLCGAILASFILFKLLRRYA